MRQLRPNASAPVPSNFRVVQGQICSIQRVHKDDGAIVILSDLTREIGNIELEKDGNEHQHWAREGRGLMLDCACVLYLCISAGAIVALLLSNYFIFLPLLVLVLVFFWSSFSSSGDLIATVTALLSGRSPHGIASSILRSISSSSWAPWRIDTLSSAKIMLMTDMAGSELHSVPAMDLRGWVRASSGKHEAGI